MATKLKIHDALTIKCPAEKPWRDNPAEVTLPAETVVSFLGLKDEVVSLSYEGCNLYFVCPLDDFQAAIKAPDQLIERRSGNQLWWVVA